MNCETRNSLSVFCLVSWNSIRLKSSPQCRELNAEFTQLRHKQDTVEASIQGIHEQQVCFAKNRGFFGGFFAIIHSTIDLHNNEYR